MKIESLQFQATAAAPADPLERMIHDAEEAIYRLYAAGMPVYVGYSGGKDSSVVADVTFRAALRAKRDGHDPVTVVGTSRTLVENPEIEAHYMSEHAKMRAYAVRHGLNIRTEIIEPTLASTWQVKILSGRGLPSFPGSSSDCTTDLKVAGQTRFRKMLFKGWLDEGRPEPVTVLGVRREESAVRAARMKERGDSAIEPVRNRSGELVLSPIADWSELDVFEHLGNISNGLIESYSDFKETDRIYAHSAGTSCSVVAMDVHGSRKSTGCGARHGCWTCQKAEDKSLSNMIDFDPRYEYARGLNKFNKLLRATRYDWTKRHWVGRTIKQGFVEIKPDTYHPAFLRDLTRYMLQLDYDEKRRALRAGERPRFHVFSLEMMIAIDALQSMNGLARPFQIWADYRDIITGKVRYDIPDVEPVPRTPMPKARYLYVGEEWDESAGPSAFTGMRSEYLEALCEGSPCLPELKTLKNGRAVWDAPRELEFSVDPESAAMIWEFEVENLVRQFDQGAMGITWAYKWYLQYGCLVLSNSQLAKHDEVLRRTAFKQRHGLVLDYSIADLLGKAVSFDDLPTEAQRVWGSSKNNPSPTLQTAPQAPTAAADHQVDAEPDEDDLHDEMSFMREMGFEF